MNDPSLAENARLAERIRKDAGLRGDPMIEEMRRLGRGDQYIQEAERRRRERAGIIDVAERVPLYLTVTEAAALLRCKPTGVYDLHRHGKLPGARKFGGRVLINRRVLLRAIEAAASDGEVETK